MLTKGEQYASCQVHGNAEAWLTASGGICIAFPLSADGRPTCPSMDRVAALDLATQLAFLYAVAEKGE